MLIGLCLTGKKLITLALLATRGTVPKTIMLKRSKVIVFLLTTKVNVDIIQEKKPIFTKLNS
jgi:hypothetical protein